jgi:hypothetical protein
LATLQITILDANENGNKPRLYRLGETRTFETRPLFFSAGESETRPFVLDAGESEYEAVLFSGRHSLDLDDGENARPLT